MKNLLLSGLFCCIMTGSMSAGDVVPFLQNVATGAVEGVILPASGIGIGLGCAKIRRGLVAPQDRGDGRVHLLFGLLGCGTGTTCGIAHGLKKIIVDREYTSGTMTIAGSIAVPGGIGYWYWRQIAQEQAHRTEQQQIPHGPEDEQEDNAN